MSNIIKTYANWPDADPTDNAGIDMFDSLEERDAAFAAWIAS